MRKIQNLSPLQQAALSRKRRNRVQTGRRNHAEYIALLKKLSAMTAVQLSAIPKINDEEVKPELNDDM